jgi:uncharacterized protein (DUF4415 family)
MSENTKIPGTDDAWESGQLGNDPQHARVVAKEVADQIDETLGLQMISIRLDKSLIDSFKLLGEFHGIGYQPLMRDALRRFAETEMKAIVNGMVETQRKTHPNGVPVNSVKQKKAA